MKIFEDEIINITGLQTVVFDKFSCKNGQSYIAKYSSDININELVFFLSGKRNTHFCGKVDDDAPGDVRLLPKGKFDGEYKTEFLGDCECIYVWFHSERPVASDMIKIKGVKELEPLFLKLYNIWNSKEFGYYSRSMSLFYEIINAIKRKTSKYVSNESAQKLLPAIDYLHASYLKKDFDYKELCLKTGLSYGYFKELFIKVFGVSPVKYVTKLRMEKARELLLTGRYTVTEISEMCGYDNVYYFSKVYKGYSGISPGKTKI